MKTEDGHTNGNTRRIHDSYRDESPDGPVERLTVAEAARRLGVTSDAIRKRIKRETIRHDNDPDGRVHVYLDVTPKVWRRIEDKSTDGSGDTSRDASDDESREDLVDVLRDQIEMLRGELEDWKEEARRKDTIIMQLAKRVPELEATSESRDAPETASPRSDRDTVPEDSQEPARRRSWWRQFFGFE